MQTSVNHYTDKKRKLITVLKVTMIYLHAVSKNLSIFLVHKKENDKKNNCNLISKNQNRTSFRKILETYNFVNQVECLDC